MAVETIEAYGALFRWHICERCEKPYLRRLGVLGDTCPVCLAPGIGGASGDMRDLQEGGVPGGESAHDDDLP